MNLNFEISYEVTTTEKAEEKAKTNENPLNNFVAIESKASSGLKSSKMASDGNSGTFLVEDILAKSKTTAHEYGHSLGWNNNRQLTDASAKKGIKGVSASAGGDHDLYGIQEGNYLRPGIMVARETPQNYPGILYHYTNTYCYFLFQFQLTLHQMEHNDFLVQFFVGELFLYHQTKHRSYFD